MTELQFTNDTPHGDCCTPSEQFQSETALRPDVFPHARPAHRAIIAASCDIDEEQPDQPRRLMWRLVKIMLCFLLAVAASGCSLGKSTQPYKGPRGTKPYTINGKTYYPLKSAHGFHEEGIASWYGPNFHGKKTANGETYDMYSMTAAHKLLPFNTQLRVTNKSNGKSILVRVNDRGPFVDDRVIDLTRKGAEELGVYGPGTAPVILDTVGEVKGMTASGELGGKFYVQVGAFSTKPNAQKLVSLMQDGGYNARAVWAENQGFWRVQAGPYPSLKAAEQKSVEMRNMYPHNIVIAD